MESWWIEHRRRIIIGLAAFLCILIMVITLLYTVPPQIPSVAYSLFVPTYFYPAPPHLHDWDRIIANKNKAVTGVVVNPNSGPGTSFDATYAAKITELSNAGVDIFAYVSTNYGKRSLASVTNDVDQYMTLYSASGNITGIFLDETPRDLTPAGHYQQISSYIRSKQMQIIANPGTEPNTEWYTTQPRLADVIVSAELSFSVYMQLPKVPVAAAGSNGVKLWHIVYGVENFNVPSVMRQMETLNVTYGYITNGIQPNPYNGLPRYWDSLVNLNL